MDTRPWSDTASERDSLYDAQRVFQILLQNKDKNFVQRILFPQNAPALSMPDTGEGGYGTHLMSYSTIGPKDKPTGAVVYPQIIQDRETGELVRLGQREAVDYAMRTGEFIKFDNPADADFFGKNYKLAWKFMAPSTISK